MASKENLRQHTVCFTGHRDLRHTDIPTRLDSLLDELCQQGFRYYGAGGALGFDTLAAEAVLRAQERYPHIKLILVLPFPKQAESWAEEHRNTYEDIKTKAAKVIYTSDRYNGECYYIRNRALVNGASLCIAYLYKNDGGTAYTVDFAKQQGIKVINIINK